MDPCCNNLLSLLEDPGLVQKLKSKDPTKQPESKHGEDT